MALSSHSSVAGWIARRTPLRAGASSSARTGTAIAVAGVAVAVIVMELTLAIVVGFKNEIRAKVLGFDPPVTVMPPYDAATGAEAGVLTLTPALKAELAAAAPGAVISPVLRVPAMLKTDSDFAGIYFVAADPATRDFAFERSNILRGEWPDYTDSAARDHIVISSITASQLGLGVGDRVSAAFFADGAVRSRRYRVAGVYASNLAERDRTVAYASQPAMRSAAGLGPDDATSIGLYGLADGGDVAADVSTALQDALVQAWQQGRLDNLYPVDNVRRSGAVYFNWLDLLDTNVVVIFVLMLCVAGFTLVSSLFIIVLDRVSQIGLLRALGATRATVSRVFLHLALRMVGRGVVIGNVIALGLLLVQKYTHAMPLDPGMYYLSYVPVDIDLPALLALNAGIVAAAWLLLLLPSRLAATVDPASTMRYE